PTNTARKSSDARMNGPGRARNYRSKVSPCKAATVPRRGGVISVLDARRRLGVAPDLRVLANSAGRKPGLFYLRMGVPRIVDVRRDAESEFEATRDCQIVDHLIQPRRLAEHHTIAQFEVQHEPVVIAVLHAGPDGHRRQELA